MYYLSIFFIDNPKEYNELIFNSFEDCCIASENLLKRNDIASVVISKKGYTPADFFPKKFEDF